MAEGATRRDDSAGDVPVSSILEKLQTELDHLAHLADQLQDMLGELIAEAAPTQNSSFLAKAQKLDVLVQSLRALAGFISVLAQTAPSHWALDPRDAAGTIKLSALARRLVEDAARETDEREGDLVLF